MTYPLSAPDSISPAAIEAAIASLRSGRYTMGTHVEQFERDFAAWVGSKHAVMVNSGSSANLLAVEAMVRPSTHRQSVWRPGDEVLVPALAWSTTIWPLVQAGLVPVFVDVNPHTLSIDWTHAEHMRSPQTRGVMLIHVLGCVADLGRAKWFADEHRVTLIEDCCESFGAHWWREHVGTFGTIGTFSHFFSHQLSTMEGGTIVTDDDAIADDLRSMRAHGWSRNRTDRATFEQRSGIDPRFLFVTSGYNVRPLDLQGAMGCVQLMGAEASLRRRDAAVAAIVDALGVLPWLTVPGAEHLKPITDRKDRTHSWMNLPIVLREDAPLSRDAVTRMFESVGIETRPLLAGNFLKHPAMGGFAFRADRAYPVADRLMQQGFMIGCHGSAEIAVAKIEDACKQLAVAA